VVAELARRRGDREAARQELLRGLEQAGPDAGLEVELAALHKETGDAAGARRLLQQVLARHPHHGDAFSHLAALALLERDVDLASDLVDRALALEPPSLAVLRPAMELALQAEPEGLPRAARLRALCRRVLAQAPDDGWASVLEGAALAQAGERDQALAILVAVTTRFPDSPFAAEAARGILVIEEPDIATELESLLKEGEGASPERARLLAERARRLAPKKPVWVHPFTVGALERRAGRTAEARAALAEATALAPAAPPVHRELGLLDAESNRPPPPSAPTPLWKALARLLRAR
jgi:tetratricopeptide (TPR) repeat protein